LTTDQQSLLSDEVLWELYNELSISQDWQKFDELFCKNSPLNIRILERLLSDAHIPNPIKQHIQSLQSGSSPREFIDERLKIIENELGLALNDYISDYLEMNKPSSAMQILNNELTNSSSILGFMLDPYNYYGYGFKGRVERIIEQDTRLANDTSHLPELRLLIDYYSNMSKMASKLNSSSINAFKGNANLITLAGVYSSVALCAAGKAKYGYNPRKPQFVNGYRIASQNVSQNDTLSNKLINSDSNMFNNLGMHIYPNPAQDKIFINIDNVIINSLNLEDLSGQIVKLISSKDNQKYFDVSNLSSGVYLIKVITKDGSIFVNKIVISN
jgi:hypothetical protein